jgi:hypothetical protein
LARAMSYSKISAWQGRFDSGAFCSTVVTDRDSLVKSVGAKICSSRPSDRGVVRAGLRILRGQHELHVVDLCQSKNQLKGQLKGQLSVSCVSVKGRGARASDTRGRAGRFVSLDRTCATSSLKVMTAPAPSALILCLAKAVTSTFVHSCKHNGACRHSACYDANHHAHSHSHAHQRQRRVLRFGASSCRGTWARVTIGRL